MRNIILLFLFLQAVICVVPALADTYVQPYARQDGTQVPGHYRSNPDGNSDNNWSTKGNVNPHTGQEGTHNSQSNNTFQNQR